MGLPSGIDRRTFVTGALAGAAALGAPGLAWPARRAARGPKVILIRFGGGVRRRETIDPDHTYAPYLRHVLAPRGTLFTNAEITSDPGIDTSHGQGTLNLLIGRYAHYQDVNGRFLGDRFEAAHPTLFEYLRRTQAVDEHEVLLVNGEDRKDEEFYSFSNHPDFGLRYRCNVLSLYRFKVHLLRRQIREGGLDDAELAAKRAELEKLEALDHRTGPGRAPHASIDAFWERWRAHYGESGFVNPRGDRLLTELAVRALRELRPRFMMINYNDADYVHWGNPTHYTRGIAIMDEGLQRLVAAVEGDPFYRDDTLFAIAPDCGRDDNRFMAVPYQHHFNSRSSREVFALFFGPGIARGQVVDRRVEQIAVTATIGRAIGVPTPHVDAPALEEVFA